MQHPEHYGQDNAAFLLRNLYLTSARIKVTHLSTAIIHNFLIQKKVFRGKELLSLLIKNFRGDTHQHHWLCSPFNGRFSQHNTTQHFPLCPTDTIRCDAIYNIACKFLLTEYDCNSISFTLLYSTTLSTHATPFPALNGRAIRYFFPKGG